MLNGYVHILFSSVIQSDLDFSGARTSLEVRDGNNDCQLLLITNMNDALKLDMEQLQSTLRSLYDGEVRADDLRRPGFKYFTRHYDTYNRYTQQVS